MKYFRKVIILLLLSASLFSCSKKDNEIISENRQAIVFEICEGDNLIVTHHQESEKAYEGMRLVADDVISTDENTSAYLRIDGDKNILLGKSTTMEITELKSGKLSLTLTQGEFFFDVVNALDENETMDFNMSNASMSIRGTSGAGRIEEDDTGTFSIYTGLGVLTQKDDDTSSAKEITEYPIAPGTKAVFSAETEEESEKTLSVQLDTVTIEDVPEIMNEYIADNEEYKEKLQEKNWQLDDDDEIATPPEEAVPSANEEIKEEELNKYIGWRQNKDGSWSFNEEDYKAGIGPTYYEEEDDPSEIKVYVNCNNCGKSVEESTTHYCAGCSETLCSDCAEKLNVQKCYHCGIECCINCQNDGRMVQLCNGNWICGNCCTVCGINVCSYPGCNNYIDNSTYSDGSSEKCDGCNQSFCSVHKELTTFTSGNRYCSNCLEDAHQCAFCDTYVWTKTDDGYSYYCEGCNQYVCGNCDKTRHSSITTICGSHYCADMAAQLNICLCGKYICINHMNQTSTCAVYCSNCGQYYCRDCYPSDGICSCGEQLPSFATVSIQNKPLFHIIDNHETICLDCRQNVCKG